MGFSRGAGGLSPLRIVLAGVALNALLGAVTGRVMILYADRVQAVLGWTLRSLSGRSWPELQRMLPLTALGAVLAVGSARLLRLFLLPEEAIRGLGVATTWVRLMLITVAALLAAGAVSATGLISFVGLVIPPMARLLPALRGAAVLDGRAIHTFPSREVARCLAILPQGPESPADLTVRELVALGRWPHRRLWHTFGAPHDAAGEWAMAVTAMNPLTRRSLATLSGGERQPAWIAMGWPKPLPSSYWTSLRRISTSATNGE